MKKLILTLLIIHFSLLTANAQWEIINNISYRQPQGFTDNGNIFYSAVFHEGVYKSTNFGINWTLSSEGINTQSFVSICAKDSFVFLASESGLFRSTNYGITWNYLSDVGSTFWVNITDNYVFVGRVNGILRSSDWGNNWVYKNNGLPTNKDSRSFSFSNNNIYTGISDNTTPKIFKSTNFGEDWIYISQDIQNNDIPYSLYACENLLLCGTIAGVYKTTNGGINWNLITNIPNSYYGLYGFASIGMKNIFITSWEYGFYVSNDSGYTFIQKNEGLQSLRCTALRKFGNYLFLGTSPLMLSYNTYRRPISEVVEVNKTGSEIPESYKLYQNYPNPFNSHTIIKFQIKDSRFVALKIHDVSGKEITTPVSEKKSAGIYEVNFNAGNLSSGIYFYSLHSDGKIMDTKKMILLK